MSVADNMRKKAEDFHKKYNEDEYHKRYMFVYNKIEKAAEKGECEIYIGPDDFSKLTGDIGKAVRDAIRAAGFSMSDDFQNDTWIIRW
jgi:hypothetical protein